MIIVEQVQIWMAHGPWPQELRTETGKMDINCMPVTIQWDEGRKRNLGGEEFWEEGADRTVWGLNEIMCLKRVKCSIKVGWRQHNCCTHYYHCVIELDNRDLPCFPFGPFCDWIALDTFNKSGFWVEISRKKFILCKGTITIQLTSSN